MTFLRQHRTPCGMPLLLACLIVGVLDARSERPANAGESWTMHHMRDDYLIANSLQPGDVNGDGFDDYAVIDEYLGLQTILFHPGPSGDVRAPWPRVVLGKTGNPEYSCLGDLDQDGQLDLVVVEGDDLAKGIDTGIRVWWGPTKDRVTDPAAWIDGGQIPGTGGEQYLYCLTADLNADGVPDILVGGRRHIVTKRYAGIRWLHRGKDAPPRELANWKTSFIDAKAFSGHGLVPSDVDEDGDLDLLNANADFDTLKFDQELAWYRNPGPASVIQPWEKQVIRKDGEAFYGKPQVAVGDLNRDGQQDLATQSQNFVEVYRKDLKSTEKMFFRTRIPKPDWVQWIGRPIKMVDLDGDGSLEIVGALIHLDGMLPADKASVFMMKQTGDPFTPGGWSYHPIKWSDGFNSRDLWRGEKWDHLLFSDVDRDGDLDIVGNVEEHFTREPDGSEKSFFSVVWFENPLRRGDRQP